MNCDRFNLEWTSSLPSEYAVPKHTLWCGYVRLLDTRCINGYYRVGDAVFDVPNHLRETGWTTLESCQEVS